MDHLHELPTRRNSLRHPGYDYTTAGANFVTVWIHDGICLFGDVWNKETVLNPFGVIALESWTRMTVDNPRWEVDCAVIMPNHANHGHALLWLIADVAPTASTDSPPQRDFHHVVAGSLSVMVRNYKGRVTRQAVETGLIPRSTEVWQRNFYDHIVRNQAELDRIRSYICSNPERWEEDQLHPNAPPNPFDRDIRRFR